MSSLYLRRYTDLTALIYLLSTKTITLLDPQSWDDSNDSHYLEVYRDKSGLQSVLALCFTETDERYHYWRVFGSAASGVCIRFRRKLLLAAVRKQHGIKSGPVQYVKLAKIDGPAPALQRLPFIKRWAFKDEREYRLIFRSKDRLSKLDIPIHLSCIDQITLSPWLHPELFPKVRKAIRSIDGCAKIEVRRSTLIGNDEWKARADAVSGKIDLGA